MISCQIAPPDVVRHQETEIPLEEEKNILHTVMASSNPKPITRIACFKFRTTVTPEQKGDRTRSFLELYEKHPELVLGMPRGGKPLHTPLDLTDVKRESGWDTGFIVKFKVKQNRQILDGLRRDKEWQTGQASNSG